MPQLRNGDIVKAGWRSYAEHVLPTGAPSVQVRETRRAFYAGARHLLGVLEGIGDHAVTEDGGVAILQSVSVELTRFLHDVEAGRA